MEDNRRVAEAMTGSSVVPSGNTRSNEQEKLRTAQDIGQMRFDLIQQHLSSAHRFSASYELMFGSYQKSKALCSCGKIVEMDSTVVRLKRRLGKEIECRTCRNERIGKDFEALETHSRGEEDEGYS